MAQTADKRVQTLILSLGSNLGDRLKNLSQAKRQLEMQLGSIEKESSVYQTKAWGAKDLNSFLNMVITIKTKEAANRILSICLSIENELGRIRTDTGVYENRPMDVDILYYGDLTIDSKELTIPHPRLHLRNFVLTPLNEIAPNFQHPLKKKTTSQLLLECTDTSEVDLFS